MADYTTTTNLNLKKPAIGGSSDKWGEYLNENLETIGTSIVNLQTASTSRSLESLNNVLDTTPTTGQLLQYDTANWQAATVTIPDNIQDLTNVTISSPSDGQVLAWSNSNSRWENQTPGAATIPDGTITTAKLSTSLQGQVNLILQTTGTPTDNQVLQYNETSTNWEFVDLPGGNISTLSDTDVSAVALGNALMYNASGDWEARDIVIGDVTNLQTTLDTKLESSDLDSYVTSTSLTTTLGSYVTSTTLATELADYTETASLALGTLNNVTLTTPANNDFLVYDSVSSDWENQPPTNARTALGLGTISTQDSDDVTITGGNISGIVDLAIADGGTGASSVGAARTNLGLGALATQDTITESQISDLGTYLTAETNDLSAAVTWVNVPDANITQSSVTQHQAALSITESQISDLGSYQPSDAGLTSISGLTTAADQMIYTTASDTYSVTTLTTAGRALLDDADAEAQRTTLGLGSAATSNTSAFESAGSVSTHAALTEVHGISAFGATLVDDADATAARTTLGLGTAATTATTDYATATQGATADSALQDLVEDLSPQLGGNLDVNGNSIVSVSAGNISITPDTTGKIILDGLSWPTSDGSADQVLKTDGSGNLSFVDQSGGGGSGSSYIEHSSTVSDSLAISSGTNRMYVGNTTFSGSGTMGGYLVVSHGYANFTGTVNVDTTGTLKVVS